jgi:hypothetical protein
LRRELRQQAVRISAWFVEMHKDSHGEAGLPRELRARAADVELLNNSEDPVTDVLVFLSRVSYKVQRWWDQEPEYRGHDRRASTRTMDHQRAQERRRYRGCQTGRITRHVPRDGDYQFHRQCG